jgi:hypothetical protein
MTVRPLQSAWRFSRNELSGKPGVVQGVRDPGELDRAFSAMKEARAGALIVESSSMLFTSRTRLADLALKNRLPTMFAQREYAEAGGLMVYSADFLGSVPPNRHLCGQDLEGRRARRSPCRAADEMGVRDQPENGEGPRLDDPAFAAGAGGSGN